MFITRKMLRTLLLPVAIASAAIASPAHSQNFYNLPTKFVHESSGFRVTSWTYSDGSAKLRGVNPDGRRFQIQVSNKGRVTGTFNGKPINYMLDERTRLELAMN